MREVALAIAIRRRQLQRTPANAHAYCRSYPRRTQFRAGVWIGVRTCAARPLI
jgi:hypothetical protein